MKLKRTMAVTLAVLLVAGFYATPYLALQQMRKAATQRDGEALSRQVDFEALRASVKRGVQQGLIGEQRDGQGDPAPARVMGAAVAAALLGPMVDALITPQSLARLLQGQRPAAAVIPGSAAPPATDELQTRMGYESFNRFVFSLRPRGSQEEPVELVLHRDGLLGWKLAELRLP
jgi:hypothetical protein